MPPMTEKERKEARELNQWSLAGSFLFIVMFILMILFGLGIL